MAARVTLHVVEAVLPRIAYSPTTVTGAGVTLHVVEAITAGGGAAARVTQHVVEAIISQTADGGHGGGSSATTSFGYAV